MLGKKPLEKAPQIRDPTRKIRAMGSETIWEIISTAPFGRDLELAVIELDRVYALVFACQRTADGWIDAKTGYRVAVSPTHWRPWPRN